jgi:predicted Zn-dependent protease
MHEIGHALGLDHPEQRSQLMHFKYDESRTGLQAGDIAGAVKLYGPPPAR